MDTQWYRSPSFIILMIFGAVLWVAVAIDRPTSPPPDFDPPSDQAVPPPVSNMKGDPSVMNLPLDVLTERLAQKLKSNPDDLSGWTLLGRSYATLGQQEKSMHAFEKALTLAPDDVDLRVTYGETLISGSGGRVTPEAHNVLLAAHKIDPEHPGVRYNLALADHQAGNSQKAHDALTDLMEKAPSGAPWVKKVQDLLNKVTAGQNGVVSPAVPAQSIPSNISPATEPLPAESNQEVFIRSMVDRLAARMEKNPSDLEGWLKLGRSYKVLGEYDQAARAYEKALALAPDDPEVRKLYQAASQSGIEAKH